MKSRLKRILETVKSALLTLLFISMTALVCVYIVRTQRMTLESADNIDIGRMLTLRSGDDSFISGFSAERVLPECVAVKIGGEGRAIMGGRGILAGALSLLSDPLSAILSDAVPVTGIPEEDVDAVWLACCSAKDSVYIRFRSPLPAPVLLLYISGGGEAEGEPTSASACYIEELFILPTEAFDDGSGIRGCRAVARDGYGNTFRIDGEGMTVDLPAIASYSANSEFSGFVFAGAEESPSVLPALDLEDSAVVTRGESPQLCAVFTYDA
ncbi:MAG: hypothetical protein K6D94_01850, partial [Clostridiales bacterium]|nr:hypothetical protein [Clostridiales bacterium]